MSKRLKLHLLVSLITCLLVCAALIYYINYNTQHVTLAWIFRVVLSVMTVYAPLMGSVTWFYKNLDEEAQRFDGGLSLCMIGWFSVFLACALSIGNTSDIHFENRADEDVVLFAIATAAIFYAMVGNFISWQIDIRENQ